MDVRFLTTAQIELDESFDFYEQQIEGLGYDFIMEVLATVKRIKNNPEAWAIISQNPEMSRKQVPIWNNLSGQR